MTPTPSGLQVEMIRTFPRYLLVQDESFFLSMLSDRIDRIVWCVDSDIFLFIKIDTFRDETRIFILFLEYVNVLW